jgi:hypothetical protein
MNEFNFIHEGTPEGDMDLFFGPLSDEDEFITFGDGQKLAHLFTLAQCFSSAGQAKKAGWNRPVPRGYSEWTVGKRKVKVYILNEGNYNDEGY